MINIKTLDRNRIKLDEEPYKDVLLTKKERKKVNCLKPLYLIINKINWYIEENTRNKHLTLVPAD